MMVRYLFALIFMLFFAVSALAENPRMMALELATQRLTSANRQAQPCDSKNSCAPFMATLQREDFSSAFMGALKSRAPACQRMVDRASNPLVANTFSGPADLASEFAKMYPQIGRVNQQQIVKCNPSGAGGVTDASGRYRVAKFYNYMARFNEGATRAQEEIAAINQLLGDKTPLDCTGRGTIPQAFNRCQQLNNSCTVGNSQLATVAAESKVDEDKYLAAKQEIQNIQRTCLILSNDYKKHAEAVTAQNPQTQRCEEVFVERQAPRKVCTTYTWAHKQKMAQCGEAQKVLHMTMAGIEDKNPWFRSENYFKLRKDKEPAEAIREHMLTNRRELKKKIGEFEKAGLCINGFESAANCDSKKVRALLDITPDLPAQGVAGRTGRAWMYQEVQACVEEGVKDQRETAKVLWGAARDAGLTVATFGLSGVATGAKIAISSGVRGVQATRVAALGGTIAIDAFYASQSYKDALSACAGSAQKLRIAAPSEGRQCPGPQSQLSQAQKEHTNCMSSVGFAALDSLPLVPFLARTAMLMRDSAARAAVRTEAPAVRAAATVAPTRAAPAPPTLAPRVRAADDASDVAGGVTARPPVRPAEAVTAPAVPATRAAPRAITEADLDMPAIRNNSAALSRELGPMKVQNFLNPDLDSATVVRSIDSTQGANKVEGFGGFSNGGVEILNYNGKQVFAKIPRGNPADDDFLLVKELFFTKKLDELGVGPEFLGVTRGADGKYRIVTELIEGTDLKVKKVGSVEKIEGDLSFVNEGTIQQIREINKKLVNAGIDPADLQYRIDRNGKAYVVDTGWYNPLGEGSEVAIARQIEEQADILQHQHRKFNESAPARAAPTPAPSPAVVRVAPEAATPAPAPNPIRETSRPSSTPADVAPSSGARAPSSGTSVRSQRDQLVSDNLNLSLTTTAQNSEWIRKASRVQPDGKTKFFIVENAAMKDLNDLSLDKDLVTALTNKRLQMTNDAVADLLKKFPQVDVTPYSDFKSMRYAFSPKPPATRLPVEFERQLEKAYTLTNEEFAKFVRSQGVSAQLGDPADWFRAGYGRTGDQAGYAARDARGQVANKIENFDDRRLQARLNDNVQRTEKLRNEIIKDPDLSKLMDKSAGRSSFRTEVFEIARKSDDASEVRDQISRTLGVELNEKQAQKILLYSNSVDDFSPSINIANRESASLAEAIHGGISLDFKGMGALNLKETAEALARQKTGARAIEDVRLGEAGVTAQFHTRKLAIRESIQEIADKNGIKVEIRTSGDDMVIIPDKPFSDQVRRQISEALARRVPPSSLRVSSIPAGIPSADRARLAVLGEDIEKNLRLKLQGQVPQERLDKILFSVDMNINPSSGATAKLRTSSDNVPITEEEMRKINQAFESSVRESDARRTLPELRETAALTPLEKAKRFEEINEIPAGTISGDSKKVLEIARIEGTYPTVVSNRPALSRSRAERQALVEKRQELRQLGMTDAQIQRAMDQGIFGSPGSTPTGSASDLASQPSSRVQRFEGEAAERAGFAGGQSDGVEIIQTPQGRVFGKIMPYRNTDDMSPGSRAAGFKQLLDNESKYADVLSKQGIGPKYYGTYVGADGRPRLAYQFIDGIDLRSGDGAIEGIEKLPDSIFEKMREINRKMVGQGINPVDLQYRVTAKGEVYVIDSANFEPLPTGLRTSILQKLDEEVAEIAQIKREAEQAARKQQNIPANSVAPRAPNTVARANDYQRYTAELAKVQNSYPSTPLGELTKQRDLATFNRMAAEAAANLNRQTPGAVASDRITQHWRSAAAAQESHLADDLKKNFKQGETGHFFVRNSDVIYSKKPSVGFNQTDFDNKAGPIREVQRRFEAAFDYYMKAGNAEKAKEIIFKSPLLQNTKDPNFYFDRTFLPYYRDKKTTVGVHGL